MTTRIVKWIQAAAQRIRHATTQDKWAVDAERQDASRAGHSNGETLYERKDGGQKQRQKRNHYYRAYFDGGVEQYGDHQQCANCRVTKGQRIGGEGGGKSRTVAVKNELAWLNT